MEPVARLLELDKRYRQVLRSTDYSIRRQFANIQMEIDHLRTLHPNLTRKLESLYIEADPERVPTTGRLIIFAFDRKLLLTGEPYTEEADSP